MKSTLLSYKNGEWQDAANPSFPLEKAQLLLFFADRNLLEGHKLIGHLKNSCKNARILSCSTAGEIHGHEVHENSAIGVAIYLKHTPFEIAFSNINKHQNSFELGQHTASLLPSKELKYIMVISDGNLINGDELIQGIQNVVSKSVKVSGGLSGDGNRFQKTIVGVDDNLQTGNVVLLGLYGNHIQVGTGYNGGWDMFGPERSITRSKGNKLFEIDGQNALELYKKYLGKYAEELPASALMFPISVKSQQDDIFIVRTILSIDEKEQSMTFAGNVPEGSIVRFMKSNYDRLIEAASAAGRDASLTLGKNVDAELSILVSCVGRKLVLADRIEEEVEAALEQISKPVVAAGFFSYGEIAPQEKTNQIHLHNQTLTITTFAELP
jgi:hypothetical protein